jgi:lipase chaperone LimK
LAAHDRDASDSLDGTDVAGGFFVDPDGNFQPTADAITLFEYFLSTLGEKPEADVVERIRAEIRRRLSPPADAQALAFLDVYLTYRERAVALAATDAGEEDLRARFDRLRALRREVFGEDVATRVFADDEAVAEVALRQREVAADPELSDAEKAERIEKLYDELPAPMRAARTQALAATRLRADEARIRAEGGSEEDIRALRVERFGEEAADRLEALDARRAEWDTRLAAFRSERARILADSELTAQERSAAIARLLAESFDEAERIRIDALDHMASERSVRD